MSALEELYEDYAYEEAEGMSDLYDDDLEMDEMDYYDEDEFDDEFDDDFDDDDGFDESNYFDDDFDDYDDFDEYDEDDDFEDGEEEALDNMMAYALDSEDADEFFKKLFRRVKKFAKKTKRVVGKVGRIAAPILSAIPLPQAQLAARLAKMAGRLRAEGASEDEILEAVATVATKDRRALPILAGLTANTILKGKGKTMSFRARKKVVKDMKKAAKVLVSKQGKNAPVALAKIANIVKRKKGIPTKAKVMIVKRTAMKVAKSPTMTRKLARPSAKAKMVAKQVVKAKSYTIPGPARITITAV